MNFNIKNPNNDVERRILSFELRKEKIAFITELIVFVIGVILLIGFVCYCLLNV